MNDEDQSWSEDLSRAELLQVRVADMHLLGATQVEIAQRFEISQPRVSQLLDEARTGWRARLAQNYEDHVAEALATLHRILKATEKGLSVGDPRSVEAATKLAERIAKLVGLDHADRISERQVRVEEAKVQVLGSAMAAVLDHLGVVGSQREEALNVLEVELNKGELL